jgi:sulfatase maturation enzyme AslB (radical SAM superfamily)
MEFADQMACSELFTKLVVDLGFFEAKYCCKTQNQHISLADIDRHGHGVVNRNDQIMRARADMLVANRLPEICRQCHGAGSQSFFRLRNRFDHVLTPDERVDLLTRDVTNDYEIVVGNACDLKCIYCNERFSTSWGLEKGIRSAQPDQSWTDRITASLLASMEERFAKSDGSDTVYITITGGEPTYVPGSLSLLEDIAVRLPHVKKEFVIITNGNMNPAVRSKWLDAIDRHEHVSWSFAFSLDDVGKRCEAIRYGLSWDTAMGNMDALMGRPNVFVFANPTFNLFSIPGSAEFIRYFAELFSSKQGKIFFGDNMVNNRGIGVPSLPLHYRSCIDDAIEYCMTVPQDANWIRRDRWMSHLSSVRSAIGTECNNLNRDAMLAHLRYLAEKRPDVDMMAVFPHLHDVIDWYAKNVD